MPEQTLTNWPLEIAKIATPFIASGLAAFIAYTAAMRKMRRENPMALQRQKYEAILAAHTRAWSLIAYMTETENELSIIRWQGKKDEKTYLFQPANAQKFMQQLRLIFYDEGHGLFLSRKVCDPLFEYRNKVFGFLLAHENETVPVTVQNKELAKQFFQLAETMRKEIRNAIELKQRVLRLDD